MGTARRDVGAPRKAAHAPMAPRTRVGPRVCRRRRGPSRLREPAAEEDRTGSVQADRRRDRSRDRLPMVAPVRRGARGGEMTQVPDPGPTADRGPGPLALLRGAGARQGRVIAGYV